MDNRDVPYRQGVHDAMAVLRGRWTVAVLAADNAMFAAKDSGRDQVRAVMPSRGPERRSPSPAE